MAVRFTRFDHHGEAAADDAIAVAPTERSLHARDAFVWHTLHQPDVKADPAIRALSGGQKKGAIDRKWIALTRPTPRRCP